ncbi:uncharacterized protein F4812DRAFT_461397 [Daldinia caldariorum]|uniref:uncharacterized protein n=1 Tax=Daldinia caldariorum TaxID=326644 RepID=UPI0020078EE0|nr:uncharacterized protein F4812DRAFT_461397 [Daldinia caldariorum]KAI1465702.1 hypothetical protein F4812DRAFT_461397 [Daldinia caldariorum]
MYFLTGTSKLVNRSSIPAGVSKAAAISLLHDHDFFFQCEPHYVSHRALPSSSSSSFPSSSSPNTTTISGGSATTAYQIPRDVQPVGDPAVRVYEVVDHVPNPVWSSSVVSTEEFVDLADGLWVRIRSPLAVVMETRWTIRERREDGKGRGGGEEEREGEGELELVEDVTISCSKLLMGIVKSQVDSNWREIHRRIAARLVEDARKEREAGKAGRGEGEGKE